MKKSAEDIINKAVTNALTDRDIIGKNIKETCKRVYEQGYKDGFNEGFKWNLTKR